MAGPAVSHPRWTLVATGLGLFMIFLDATIVNVALPDIQRRVRRRRAGPAVGRGGVQPDDGHVHHVERRPADRHGRRRVFVAGVVLFAAASVACGLAPNISVLTAPAAAQGIGAAMVNVVVARPGERGVSRS